MTRSSERDGVAAIGGLEFEKTIATLVKDVELLHKQLLAEVKERESAERALRRSEETVRALLNAPPDTALLIDRKGTILAANETALTRLGVYADRADSRNVDGLVGVCVYDLFPPDVAMQRKARNEEVLKTGRPARFEDDREGSWFDNSIYPVRGARGRIVGLAVFSREITDRKRAEESMRRSQETVRALLNAPTDSALLIDARGMILALNETARTRLAAHATQTNGDDAEQFIGQCVYDLFPPELAEHRRVRNEEVIRSGQPARFEDQREGAWAPGSTTARIPFSAETVK
jgi:PAS domain S-box-containing protein